MRVAVSFNGRTGGLTAGSTPQTMSAPKPASYREKAKPPVTAWLAASLWAAPPTKTGLFDPPPPPWSVEPERPLSLAILSFILRTCVIGVGAGKPTCLT